MFIASAPELMSAEEATTIYLNVFAICIRKKRRLEAFDDIWFTFALSPSLFPSLSLSRECCPALVG